MNTQAITGAAVGLNARRFWRAFNAIDIHRKVGNVYVFDIGGNKYRLIAAIHFNRKMVFIRHIFTHRQYDKWTT